MAKSAAVSFLNLSFALVVSAAVLALEIKAKGTKYYKDDALS